ncbi:hypothetical protein [Mycobacterium intracellulare]|uniref:hypothetical protein n=1 Tax=Mycobacterium intracellulare TaxID=1767 RepID=UPI000C79B0DF|nr:hypothetical protein [Mycobacterium intracellulare]
MSVEHIPTAIVTATLLLRLVRLVRRELRALIRTALLAIALTGGALMLAGGPGHLISVGPLLHAL